MNSLKTYDSLGKTYHLAGPDVMSVAEQVPAGARQQGAWVLGTHGLAVGGARRRSSRLGWCVGGLLAASPLGRCPSA